MQIKAGNSLCLNVHVTLASKSGEFSGGLVGSARPGMPWKNPPRTIVSEGSPAARGEKVPNEGAGEIGEGGRRAPLHPCGA